LRKNILISALAGLFLFWLCMPSSGQEQQGRLLIPVIEGDFWQIAGNPDLGELTGENQQPVDFGIWQADDGTWQLWSCIRGTECGGNTRLFYRWEGSGLEQKDWEPGGIAMIADTLLGEQPGGLQAPHVIQQDGIYHMFYGDWSRICLAVSQDGKNFYRVLKTEDGEPDLFSENLDEPPRYNHARDPMVIKSGNTYYCYYTSHTSLRERNDGAAYCRTSMDRLHHARPGRDPDGQAGMGGAADTK
jgi:hypothetical protein